jgi:hypothetical protein
MTPSRVGILRSRATLLAALLYCVYEALPTSITTLRSVSPSVMHERDPILIVGLAYALFIAASIAGRSPAVADRLVFGAGAIALALSLLRQALLPIQSITSIIGGLQSLLWTAAAVVTLVCLITSFGRSDAA